MAMGVIAVLRDAGRSVPDDVSMIDVGDSLKDTIAHVGLTTIRFNLIERGKSAFEHAILGAGPNYKVCQIKIPRKRIERASVKNIR
jgi:DNA-binding LacI/PurR family transcriptional regulator